MKVLEQDQPPLGEQSESFVLIYIHRRFHLGKLRDFKRFNLCKLATNFYGDLASRPDKMWILYSTSERQIKPPMRFNFLSDIKVRGVVFSSL